VAVERAGECKLSPIPAYWQRLLLKSLWTTVYHFSTGVFDRVQTEYESIFYVKITLLHLHHLNQYHLLRFFLKDDILALISEAGCSSSDLQYIRSILQHEFTKCIKVNCVSVRHHDVNFISVRHHDEN
jgi:hypothetical protein